MASIRTVLTVLYPLIQGLLCAELFFLASKPVKLLDPSTVFLSRSGVTQSNKYMLGLSAEAPLTWTSEGDILKRPRALAIITVDDGKALTILPTSGYALSNEGDDFDHQKLIGNEMFGGEEQHWLLMRSTQFSGSQIASDVQNIPQKIEVKTKTEPLRKEIENIYKIAEMISESKVVSTARTPTIFIIDVKGLPLAEKQTSVEEYNQAVNELGKAISYLTSVLEDVYDKRVIVELITDESSKIRNRQKRQNDQNTAGSILETRKNYRVYQFVSTSYPAVFAIFAGVSIVLALAVLFIAVGLWNMDPGKDSIIYRMTTTRMKKD